MTTATAEHEQGTEPLTPPVTHLAKCRQCDVGVTFHKTSSGTGIVVLERHGLEIDTTIGMGEGGMPICPRGHGEMTTEDEKLPAAEAIAQAAAQLRGGELEPLQGTLPGIVPAFNYQGAYLELEAKAVECDQLRSEYQTSAEETRDAKKRWDKAEEIYTKMALEFRRRRREKAEGGSPIAAVDPDRCTFEQLNPDASCPLCDGSMVDDGELAIAPRTSAEHAQQADAMLLKRAIADLIEQLEACDMSLTPETVREWSAEDRAIVSEYVNAVIGEQDPLPERPKILGTMHVAGEPTDEGAQACTQCDAVLRTADDEIDNYIPGWMVGTDCPGKPVEEHRYITRKKKAAKGKGRK